MNTLRIIAIAMLLYGRVQITYVAPFAGQMTVDAKCGVADAWVHSGWFNSLVLAGTNTVALPKPPCGRSAFFRVHLQKP